MGISLQSKNATRHDCEKKALQSRFLTSHVFTQIHFFLLSSSCRLLKYLKRKSKFEMSPMRPFNAKVYQRLNFSL